MCGEHAECRCSVEPPDVLLAALTGRTRHPCLAPIVVVWRDFRHVDIQGATFGTLRRNRLSHSDTVLVATLITVSPVAFWIRRVVSTGESTTVTPHRLTSFLVLERIEFDDLTIAKSVARATDPGLAFSIGRHVSVDRRGIGARRPAVFSVEDSSGHDLRRNYSSSQKFLLAHFPQQRRDR